MKLFTAGYEGSSPSELFECLRQSGVKLLIDVRDVPISRKRGFSKTSLAAGLASVGIDYLHLKGLGDPKPGRVAAREGRYAEFRKIFGAHMRTSAAQQALATAVSKASLNHACLLCFERDHTNCHRSIVAESMIGLKPFSVVHLTPNAPSRSIIAKERVFPRAGAVAHIG
ncbi:MULTISPECIES: DUF488 domain-containing protein [Bradyrhizobium]|uniref:DUF488 domain-containing protein n=1 Tax=Bradyrhizobium TaxID=374 RepID=UPI0009DA3D5F|nr:MULTISPECIES: DUF488 domain-containing protein [Bradyrhizobium]MCA1375687.1 DUF488 domain-containing protein [Bradyrhizobium sp. IC4060]MCA1485830.1 DUF488 domain-containing protein [Bradyrhizobium sp. IC4061]